jgi:NTP pyrophosphatase (non-canonical NTP hydrolase)
MYFIYHIPGKKIGVTRNLNKRVELAQGYMPGEYEVLETSSDINYVSNREKQLQQFYGYKVDRDSYKQVIDSKNKLTKSNKMKLNITEQTITFPCPPNKLKGQLLDALGLTFETQFGKYILNDELIDWIVQNATVSMFNINRSFVYNKALSEHFKLRNTIVSANTDAPWQIDSPLEQTNTQLPNMKRSINEQLEAAFSSFYDAMKQAEKVKDETTNVYDLIREWADERGIYKNGDSKTQFIKLQEETGELARAILKKDRAELIDAIGDAVVVLTNLAALEGLKIEDCVESAYNVIKSRQGSMVNGTFVKENPVLITRSKYDITNTL